MNGESKIFNLLIYIAAGVIVYVIVIGGIVCIKEESYTFAQYLNDLTNVWPYLAGAIVAVLLKSLVQRRNGNGNHGQK